MTFSSKSKLINFLRICTFFNVEFGRIGADVMVRVLGG